MNNSMFFVQMQQNIVKFDWLGVPIRSGIVVKTLSGTSNGVCGNADLKIVQSKWDEDGQ